jgi:integrase
LHRPRGLPVHEATLFLERFRTKGRAANTIHAVCGVLALLYRQLHAQRIDLLTRLSNGQFLTAPELSRLASAARMRVDDLSEEGVGKVKLKVVNLSRIRLRRNIRDEQRTPVDVQTQATRMRYMADFLKYISGYVGAGLPAAKRRELRLETEEALDNFLAGVPSVTKRATLGARTGLSVAEQDRLVSVIRRDSPRNPWQRGFVRRRNWMIVVLLLATGMRRGELLGLQIRDLVPNEPKLRILRRADAPEDSRLVQANTKTNDREIEVHPSIMRALWNYIEARRDIKAARKIPQIFVSDEGDALSASSIDKVFAQLREACPGLPVRLTAHVTRHSWNERFAEEADKMELSEAAEQAARNVQQVWSPDSKMGATYTRRHTARKGAEISLKLQERLDDSLTPGDQ